MFRTDLSTDGTIEILGQELFKGRVELGTVITRYEIGKAERSAKVQVNAQLALQPIFDNGMPDVGGAAVLEVLRNAIGFIGEEIIPTFEKL